MITTLIDFLNEKLGIDDNVQELTNLVYEKYLDFGGYDEVINNDIKFKININKLNKELNELNIQFSFGGVSYYSNYDETIHIGVMKDKNSLKSTKSLIMHELKHVAYKNEFGADYESPAEKIVSETGTGHDNTIEVWMNLSKYSIIYKKIFIYMYLSVEDELEARLNEFSQIIKKLTGKKDFLDFLESQYIKYYEDMKTFDIKGLTNNEKKEVIEWFNMPLKKIQSIINKSGRKFTKKIRKMYYYVNSDNNV